MKDRVLIGCAVMFSVVAAAIHLTPTEQIVSSPNDGYEQVYFGTMGEDPLSLRCELVELTEYASPADTSDALAKASELALSGCVAIRWVL